MRCPALVAVAALTVRTLAAQTPGPEIPAPDAAVANGITAAAIARHIGVIAHDSMGGRDTPSRGLERTAQYVADQFKAAGLYPAGDPFGVNAVKGFDAGHEIPWLQRYFVPGGLRVSLKSRVGLVARLTEPTGESVIDDQGTPVDKWADLSLDDAARFAVDTISAADGTGVSARPVMVLTRVQLLTGRHTPASLRRARLDPAVVLYVPPAGLDSAAERQIIRAVTATSNLVIVAAEDSATFAARHGAAMARPPAVVEDAYARSIETHWAVHVRSGAVRDFLRLARLDLVKLRADTTPRVLEVPMIGAGVLPLLERVDSTSGVNVVAFLLGSDSILREQVIAITAHMDTPGAVPGQPRRIRNGANDNGSGVAALLALAQAFGRPGARPKCSLAFVATSGSTPDKGPWGAHAFVQSGEIGMFFTLNLTLDMIGRLPGDSLLVDGLAEFDFAARPDWIAVRHPELRLKVVDGGTAFTMESDHVAFLERLVPSLYVHAARHDDEERSLNALDAVDPEQEARAVRLLYYVIHELANGARVPRWTAAAREQQQRFFGR